MTQKKSVKPQPYIIHPEQDETMLREKGVSLRALLDTVRPLNNGKYSVRLRVIYDRVVKFYTTKIKVTVPEYKEICKQSGGSRDIKSMRKLIHEHLKKAYEAIKKMDLFSFDDFEKYLDRKKGDGNNLYYHFQLAIDENKKHDRIGNANTFEGSMKSLKNYTGEHDNLSISQITPKWLSDYEYYMTNSCEPGKQKKRNKTTVGIYLRALRAVINMAIVCNDIPAEKYPFGNNKYKIPTGNKVKKALTSEQIRMLFDAKPQTPEQIKAKDFWFFSYACNGMNIMDIANLRYKDIDPTDNCFRYVRAKTKNTTNEEKEITIYLNDYTKQIIEKYGNKDNRGDNLIFPILDNKTSAEVKISRIKAFTKFINQHIKKLAIAEKLPAEISTYWARHTWATIAVRNGKSIEFVSKAIGHGDIKTTQRYFAGFEDKDIKEFAENVMNF